MAKVDASNYYAEVRKTLEAPPTPPRRPSKENLVDIVDVDDDMPVYKIQGSVGFDTLPQQVVQKATKLGFSFNLLCVGETGIGKTTLVESLFNMKLDLEPCRTELNTVVLKSKTYDIEEGNVKLKLALVETAGFADQLDKEKSVSVLMDYIDAQYQKYLDEEMKIRRALDLYEDTRIHACLYFISPTGHGLKSLDLMTMKKLCRRVNIIPVIAKADTSCKEELKNMKQRILDELRANDIEIFKFPTDDDLVKPVNEKLNACLPFAVVGSSEFVTGKNNKKIRARKYPWGIVEVENEEHCDFVKLREALLRVNIDNLRDRTHSELYETFRRDRMIEMGLHDKDVGVGMFKIVKEKLHQQERDLKKSEESLIREFNEKFAKFVAELKEKEKELDSKEASNVRLNAQLKRLDAEVKMEEESIRQLQLKKQQLEKKEAKKKGNHHHHK